MTAGGAPWRACNEAPARTWESTKITWVRGASYPNRIVVELVDHVDRLEITLLTPREYLDSYRFRRWAEEKVIGRIPGSAK